MRALDNRMAYPCTSGFVDGRLAPGCTVCVWLREAIKVGRWAIELKDVRTPVLWRHSHCIAQAAGEPTTTKVYHVSAFSLVVCTTAASCAPKFACICSVSHGCSEGSRRAAPTKAPTQQSFIIVIHLYFYTYTGGGGICRAVSPIVHIWLGRRC